jgi:IS1 family transposase
MVIMNKLNIQKRVQILSCLVEGNSIRSTARITGTSKNTVVKLLCDLGAACAEYQDKVMRNLDCKRVQCDEIWSFCYAKEKNVPADKKGQFGYGDVWTWTAIDADTKLVPAWFVGNRDSETAKTFIEDLKSRLKNRVQLTTDGNSTYLQAVEEAFGCEIDYAMLIKLYGTEPEGEKRYSPAKCLGAEKHKIMGNPDSRHISTSFAERQNLTMRMSMRRFTRLTNAFSKKIDNLVHSLSIYFMYYNFGRIHKSLRVTPAMEAKVADHVWSLEEIVDLID